MALHVFSRSRSTGKRTLRCMVLWAILAVLLCSCGQSGPLKLPEDDKKEEAAKQNG